MRLSHDSNQTFNDGTVKICCEKNVAEPGDMPRIELAEMYTLHFREMTNTVERRYEAKTVDIISDRKIRVPYVKGIAKNMTAKVTDDTGAGAEYRVTDVIKITQTTPPVLDLSLEKRGEES